MSWLRIFVLALLVAPAAPTVPALAAPLMPSQAPTMQSVDPGVDHTERDADLPANYANSRCPTGPNSRQARSS